MWDTPHKSTDSGSKRQTTQVKSQFWNILAHATSVILAFLCLHILICKMGNKPVPPSQSHQGDRMGQYLLKHFKQYLALCKFVYKRQILEIHHQGMSMSQSTLASYT